MKISPWILLLVCAAWWVPVLGHTAASPQDDYLQIYVMIQDGDRLATAGQNSQGREKFENALSRLEKLKNENPEWEPTIVKYRIKYLNEKLEAMKAVKDSAPAVAAPAAKPAPASAPAEKTAPAPQSSESLPATTPKSVAPPVASDDPSALRQKIISLSGELESARTELRQAKSDLDLAVSDKKQLQEKLSAVPTAPSADANLTKL
ncbi:MAG: hypothetical protein WCJ23_00780, partial [Verrucomicrobiota bacterium]